MGLFSKDIQSMDDLLLHGLQDVYYAENQITKALPKLIKKATNRDLSTGLKDHLKRRKGRSSGSTRLSRSSESSRRA
jgi:ferritin-like metal-binding protein YciE